MCREAILGFIRRKDEALDGEYIRGIPVEDLWPYDEHVSEDVLYSLSPKNDAAFCPWCLLSLPCRDCLYAAHFGICRGAELGNNYGRIVHKHKQRIVTRIYKKNMMKYVMEPLEEAKLW